MSDVSLEDLRDLFTGVPDDAGGWATTPSYTVNLAVEIARRADAQSDYALRVLLFDDTPSDEVPPMALKIIEIAAGRYREQRRTQLQGRRA